jgi:hypothetical protein
MLLAPQVSYPDLMSSIDVDVCALFWRKSRRSIGDGACVEVASTPGVVAVRDSKEPIYPALQYSAEAWRVFIARTKAGELD